MKFKNLAFTAVICTASIFGTSLAPAYAAPFSYDLQATQNIETEQLSQKVRDRNRVIGAVLGIAAIAAIANHNNKNSDDDNDNHRRSRNSGRNENTPPPPPMPNHHR